MFNQENMHEMIRKTELKEAHKSGIEQGSKETAIDIAKNLIKIGLTNEQIIETTKLSNAEIDKLRKED